MSLKTKIRGFTSWVNLRLKPYNQLMNNVLMDLLTGTNMKMLLQSMTGREIKRLDSFDGLTQQQKVTRVEWMLDELKKCKVIPEDVFVDVRMFAMRSADHIFLLLWRLLCHDIWFVWERAEFLMLENDETLSEIPFKWIPEPPPAKKKKTKTKKSLLSGFGASSLITEKIEEDDMDISESYDPFPRSDFMKKFKGRAKDAKPPAPDVCILELVNKQLKTTYEGKKLQCLTLDDLNDSRVLCALINSFIPDLFTTEVFLNDRWTINTVLRTVEKMFYIESPFDSEDLVEGESTAVCAYFCTFFMLAYKYRQSKAVANWVTHLRQITKEKKAELDNFPHIVSNLDELQRRKELKTDLENIKIAIDRIEKKFDMDFCFKWILHIEDVAKQTHKMIRAKIKDRYDEMPVPRNITINDLCLSAGINLNITNGVGFYLLDTKETVGDIRKIILRDKNSNEYIDDTQLGKPKSESVRRLLHLPERQPADIAPEKYPKYQIFIEASSRNKQLRPGNIFLYQVFPATMVTWQKIFLKAVKENEFDTVKRMVLFFRTMPAFINGKEPQTGNSPLHWACRLGHYDMVEYLLENSANIDMKNLFKQTPLFSACEGQHRSIAHLLIEWGCDIHAKGPRNQTAFETIKSDEFRDFLVATYNHYSSKVPEVMEGDTELLQMMIEDHISGAHEFNNLRSRCINGSTLVHTSAYFGCCPLLVELFGLGLDVNILDYKGASALHRARDVETIRMLMEAGALPSVEDLEGNTPLHVKCYGESGKASEVEAIEMLIKCGANLTVRNTRGLMPIHCCAMQGRADVVQMLLSMDTDGAIVKSLQEETSKKPPSLVHLSVANDFIDSAQWLLESGFRFKEGEQDLLVQRILSEQIQLQNRADAVRFLLDNGANVNPRYPAHNTALHYCSTMSGSTDLLELFLAYGAEIDAVNADGASALFFACQCNNQFAASVLIEQGTNVRLKNLQGLTAFDFIMDYEEWIECGYFSEEIRARLKAYNLKHARDLIRAISKKVKAPQHYLMAKVPPAPSTTSRTNAVSVLSNRSSASASLLPPLKRMQGALTY